MIEENEVHKGHKVVSAGEKNPVVLRKEPWGAWELVLPDQYTVMGCGDYEVEGDVTVTFCELDDLRQVIAELTELADFIEKNRESLK